LRWVGVQGLPDGEAPPSGKSSEYIQMRSKGVGHHVWHQHLAIVHLQPITICKVGAPKGVSTSSRMTQ
jgi:hypothetical protein